MQKLAIALLVLGLLGSGYLLITMTRQEPVVIEPLLTATSTPTPTRQTSEKKIEAAVDDAAKIRTAVLNGSVMVGNRTAYTYTNGYLRLGPDAYDIYSSREVLKESITVGSVDGDDTPDAFAIEQYNAGGSGNWYSLLYFEDIETLGAKAVSVELNDDVGIVNSITITPGLVVLDIYYRGPSDPNCCSSKHRAETYKVEKGLLTKVSTKELGDRPQE